MEISTKVLKALKIQLLFVLAIYTPLEILP